MPTACCEVMEDLLGGLCRESVREGHVLTYVEESVRAMYVGVCACVNVLSVLSHLSSLPHFLQR